MILVCYNDGVVIVIFKGGTMKKLIILSLVGVFVFGVGSAFAETIHFHYNGRYTFNSFKTKYPKLKREDSGKRDGDPVYLHYEDDGKIVNLHY